MGHTNCHFVNNTITRNQEQCNHHFLQRTLIGAPCLDWDLALFHSPTHLEFSMAQSLNIEQPSQ
jgi:hypothetical protein